VNYEGWKKEERDMYVPLESSILDEIYTAADIPKTNHGRRARFLA
jgi:hypothetical protein